MNQKFKSFMIDYFTDQIQLKWFRENDPTETATYDEAVKQIIESETDDFCDFVSIVKDRLSTVPFRSREHICQYEIVHALTNMYEVNVEEYYLLLFEIYEEQILSSPVCEILFSHFGEILTHVFLHYIPGNLDDIHQKERMTARLYKVLSRYVLKMIMPFETAFYRIHRHEEWDEEKERLTDTNDQNTEQQSKTKSNDEKLECDVCFYEPKEYKPYKDVKYVATLAGAGMSLLPTKIGSLITYKDQRHKNEAVTYMIIGRRHYANASEMFDDIGYELFGYTKKEARATVTMTKGLAMLGFCDEVFALDVMKLPEPVLSKEDLCIYRVTDLF